MEQVHFEVRFVNAGTGSAVWDDPDTTGSWNRVIQRVMPQDRRHGPMIGILDLAKLRPTPVVIRDVIVSIGEDVRAGRYGNFTFVVSSEDDASQPQPSVQSSVPAWVARSVSAIGAILPVGLFADSDPISDPLDEGIACGQQFSHPFRQAVIDAAPVLTSFDQAALFQAG